MKKFVIVIFTLLTLLEACAPSTDKLTFRPDGTFRILQFTDLHLQLFHPDQVADVFSRMDSLVRQADPDLIAVTGDLLYSSPADSLMQLIVARLDSYSRPWAIVYGNHDHEHGLTLAQLSPIITSGKHSINTLNAEGTLADFEIPIYKTPGRAGGDGKGRHARPALFRHARPFIKYRHARPALYRHARPDRASFYLFFLDSHAYSTYNGSFSYAWFEPEQVEWVRHTAGLHPSTPSIAFFHIPFPEYADAASLAGLEPDLNVRLYTPAFTGTLGEWVCCPKFNSGMFDAMSQTGFLASFCGHDHDNDFSALYRKPAAVSPVATDTTSDTVMPGLSSNTVIPDPSSNTVMPDPSSNAVMPDPDRASSRPMLLCYGRYSGSNGEYNHLPKGARLITLRSDGSLETCILDSSGTPSNQVHLDPPLSL
ncbi:MAG: metallophosphoesterase [Bacteroidales bacterium]|nr:metallophosphoesterase [Bacteroidales bacterium]